LGECPKFKIFCDGPIKVAAHFNKEKDFFWDTLPNYLIELTNSLPYHVPQFVALTLAQAKNGDNQSSKFTHEGSVFFVCVGIQSSFQL
jgi:hypothetical protein